MPDMSLMTWLSTSSNVWNTTANGTVQWHSVERRVKASMASSGSMVRMKLGKSLRRATPAPSRLSCCPGIHSSAAQHLHIFTAIDILFREKPGLNP